MAEVWLHPTQVFDGQTLHRNRAVQVVDGVITAIGPAEAALGAVKIAGTLTPGFVDLQVNGGGGVLFNSDPTAEGLRAIAAAHRQSGTVAILPTVITDAPDVLSRAVDAMIDAWGAEGIVGMHIEGPHIAPKRRGTHDGAFVRPFDDVTLNAVKRLRAADVPVMLTLAPDVVPPAQIAALVALGVVVSLGHTDATAAQMQDAFAAGARSATHLFNAMSPMQGREPGAVGAVINSDAFAGIICDGHHVADAMVRLAIRARPVPDRMFLVSDAMPSVGGPDDFMLYGRRVQLQDGRLINSEGGLAGAHVTQAQGVVRLVNHVGLALDVALRMATSIPAACIGRPHLGQLTHRNLSDVLVLSDDLSVRGDLATLTQEAQLIHVAE